MVLFYFLEFLQHRSTASNVLDDQQPIFEIKKNLEAVRNNRKGLNMYIIVQYSLKY